MRITNSGHQDIMIMASGSHRVLVKSDYVGRFKKIETAIKERDEYRVKNKLPPTKY